LFGTLVGSLVPLVSERAARRRARKAVWRLLGIEASNALDAVYKTRGDGSWPIGWQRTWSSTWRDSREHLLLSPPRHGLAPVAAAFSRIDELENAVNAGRERQDLSPSDQLFLWRMQGLLEQACEALEYEATVCRPDNPTEEALASWEKQSPGEPDP
jgi:hypothetical protein